MNNKKFEKQLQKINLSSDLKVKSIQLETLISFLKKDAPDHKVLSHFLNFLSSNREEYHKLEVFLASILNETSMTNLLARTGLVIRGGFFDELNNRVIYNFFPTPPNEFDISETFERIFRSHHDVEWLENLPEDIFLQILTLFSSVKRQIISKSLLEAVILLGANALSIALSPQFLHRSQIKTAFDSPFLLLNSKLTNYASGVSVNINISEFDLLIKNCFAEIAEIKNKMESTGVNVNLVHNLDILYETINRIELLLRLSLQEIEITQIQFLLVELTEGVIQTQTITGFLKSRLNLLSRKIVERTGSSGEHYIAKNNTEYFKLFIASAGGGLLTVGTTFIKFLISKVHLPLFLEGFATGINYAGSFLLLQILHFPLATKLSAMTACSLAGKLSITKSNHKIDDFLNEVAALTRSQVASVTGNVIFVSIGAYLFYLWQPELLASVITPSKAESTVASFHVLNSSSVVFAAYTGILLWIASIISGWFENWVVFNRIPEALANHRILNSFLGKKISHKFSKIILNNSAGFAANISLGFMLGFSPALGEFFGLGIDIRHITLAAGAATMSFCILPFNLALVVVTFLSIFTIGFINIAVSFTLSILTAISARNIKANEILFVLKALVKDIFYNLKKYLWI